MSALVNVDHFAETQINYPEQVFDGDKNHRANQLENVTSNFWRETLRMLRETVEYAAYTIQRYFPHYIVLMATKPKCSDYAKRAKQEEMLTRSERITKLVPPNQNNIEYTPLVIYCTFLRNIGSFCIDFLRLIRWFWFQLRFFFSISSSHKRKKSVCITNGTIFFSFLPRN